jgi:hypothetical protein
MTRTEENTTVKETAETRERERLKKVTYNIGTDFVITKDDIC